MNTLLILDLAAKSLAVLLMAFAVQTLWRGASAAQRCLVWLAAFGCLAVLPLTVLVEPQWTLAREAEVVGSIAVAPALPLTEARTTSPFTAAEPVPVAPRFSSHEAALALWLMGVVLVLAHRLMGAWRLRQLRAESVPCQHSRIVRQVADFVESLGIRRRVQVRTSDAVAVPVTWGVWQPALLLPSEAHGWDDETLSAALLHELGHIRHLDAAARLLATFACALHWPNPAVWMAARAWRAAQEQAADDLVLRSGTSAQNYALQLLQAARSFQSGGLTRAPVLAMARPATLETRLSAIMDQGRNRRPARARTWMGMGAIMLIALGSLTAVRLLGEPNKKPATDEQGAAQVLIAAHLIKAPKGTLAALIKTDAPVMFNAQDAATLVAKLQTKSGVDTLTMPRILTLDGQRAIVEVDPELVAAGDPAPVRVGPKLTFLPKIEGSQIELTVDMTVTEKIGMKGGIPIVSSRTFNSSMQFVDGQTALFVWPATASEPELIGLVTPTLIASESAKAEAVAKWVDGARKLQPIGVAMAWAVVEQKAASIIVPRVQFSGATFSEAVEFLRVKARQLDPEHQGINIVLPAKMPQAKLSMDLRDVPLSQALREVAQLSGLDLRYEGGAAVFGVVGQPAMTPTAASPATAKARAIILPNIKFANATLAEVVDFLRVKGREISPDKKGVNILIQDGAAAAEPKITLDLQQVSLFDALQHSATLAGYAVREDGNIFVLAPVKQFRR